MSFFFRGHGTYVDGNKLIASVAGVVERVNKLICVRPFKTRYTISYNKGFTTLVCTFGPPLTFSSMLKTPLEKWTLYPC